MATRSIGPPLKTLTMRAANDGVAVGKITPTATHVTRFGCINLKSRAVKVEATFRRACTD